MYTKLNKRQSTGKLLDFRNFGKGIFVNLILLDNPYKDGVRYAVIENSNSAFCSNGLFVTRDSANNKFDTMVENIGSEIGFLESNENFLLNN